MIRIASGFLLAIVVLACVWWLPVPFLLLLAEGVLVLAFLEYAGMVEKVGARLPRVVACAAACAVCAAFARPGALEVVLIAALISLGAVALASGVHGAAAVHASAASVFPMLYLGVPLGALVAIRSAFGREVVLALMGTIIASDTAQYYTGRLFGRRALAPRISPKKTVEGALGGIVFGTLAMAALGTWALSDSSITWRVGTGLAVVSAGMAGDLFESLLKRAADLKDSSHLIPGHGGVLDRIDALLFAAPVFYLLARLTIGETGGVR
jgi:phosphatidate cytidylyltransferase